ncbi:MAG TPA: C39 family peptidase [Candidatus Ozemobacteraceae bacterium]|nr:C39 family peptidase [Candidatus Ozemobacteraceae bacterium]
MNICSLKKVVCMMILIVLTGFVQAAAENIESDGFVPTTGTEQTQTATVNASSTQTSSGSKSALAQPVPQPQTSGADYIFQDLKKALGGFFTALSDLFRSLARIFSSLFGGMNTPVTGVPSPSTSTPATSVSSATIETPPGSSASTSTSTPAESSAPPSTDAARPSPEGQKTPNPVPYFSQWDNTIDDFATCQNTSIAMTLNSLGWKGSPDDITGEFGRKLGQTPDGVAEIINTLAARSGLPYRAKSHEAPLASFKEAVTKGLPVITHGWFTKSGHVVCVKGYENGNYIVNDPAGKWNEEMYGSINGWVSGEDVQYDAESFEKAIEDDVWYTEIVPS